MSRRVQREGDPLGDPFVVPPVPRTDKALVTHMDANSCNHQAVEGTGWRVCARCGSTCKRDEAGKIEIFERGLLDLPADDLAQHMGERPRGELRVEL